MKAAPSKAPRGWIFSPDTARPPRTWPRISGIRGNSIFWLRSDKPSTEWGIEHGAMNSEHFLIMRNAHCSMPHSVEAVFKGLHLNKGGEFFEETQNPVAAVMGVAPAGRRNGEEARRADALG